jgi:hypothetical protein
LEYKESDALKIEDAFWLVPKLHKSNVWISDFSYGIKTPVIGAHMNRSWDFFSSTGTDVHGQDISNAWETLVNWAHGKGQGMLFIYWCDIVGIWGKTHGHASRGYGNAVKE